MTPDELEARRAEAEAWESKLRDLARDYVQHLAARGAPPVFVFFGNRIEQGRFRRALGDLLAPLSAPLPGPADIIRPTPEAVRGRGRGGRLRLIAVEQSYRWAASRRELDDAAEADHLIDVLNRENGRA